MDSQNIFREKSVYSDSSKVSSYQTRPKVEIREFFRNNEIVLMFIIRDGNYYLGTFDLFLPNVPLADINKFRNTIRDNYLKIRSKIQKAKTVPSGEQINKLYYEIAKVGNSLRTLIENINISNTKFDELWNLLFSCNPENSGNIEVLSDSFIFPFEFLTDLSRKEEYLQGLLAYKYKFKKSFAGVNFELKSFQTTPRLACIYSKSVIPKKKPQNGNGEIINEVENFMNLEKKGLLSLIQRCEEHFSSSLELCDILEEIDFDILHFACHVEHSSEKNSCLRFGEARFTKDDIIILGRKGIFENKVIFLNGCKTENSNIDEVFGFTKLFYDYKAAIVICVDIEVPNEMANKFSIKFYNKLLEGEFDKKIDEILYLTARELLDEDNDIAGFFYSLYGKNQLN